MKTATIFRNIMGNDVPITLTEEEMDMIYNDVQFEYDKIEVKARLSESETKYNVDDIPDDLIERMAKEFRERMGNIAETMGDGRIPAMENTFETFSKELEEYVQKWRVFRKKVTMTVEHDYTIRAKDEDDAENIFQMWSERNSRTIIGDLTEDAEYDGDFDYGWVEEDDETEPDYADIQVEEGE